MTIVSTPAIIEYKALCKSYPATEAPATILNNISGKIHYGESIAICGASGAGKSTLLNIIGGLDTVSSGSIHVCGYELNQLRTKELVEFRQQYIGFVFQFYNLLPTLTALENVTLALEIRREHKRLAILKAKESLEKVGLADKMNHFPGQLSGGEQQRVSIARAIVKQPPLLLMDEPTGNLDDATSETIIQLIKNIQSQIKSTWVIVTHDQSIHPHMDRVLALSNKKLVA